MIYYLRLKNFYSIRDELEIDLTMAGPVTSPEGLERSGPLYVGAKHHAPRVVGIYGPNASGKSTILRALSLVSWYIQNSFAALQPDAPMWCQPFNTVEAHNRPIEIDIGFSGPSDLGNISSPECRYLYCISFETVSGTAKAIKIEALYYWPPGAIKRRRVFVREGNRLTSFSRAFRIGGFITPLGKIIRPNVSLISTLVQLGHEPSIWIRDFTLKMSANILVQKFEYQDSQVAQMYALNGSYLSALNKEIQRLDLGIEKVVVEQSRSNPQTWIPSFIHDGLAFPLTAGSESNGTRQFFRIFPTIAAALEKGGTAVTDELDSSIHPLILPEIIRWFYDPVRNPKNAQLWFTCQNPYLLSELSKEEIYFCEKDPFGCTTAFGLRDVKQVRRVDNYAKKYLSGAYGAIPHIG